MPIVFLAATVAEGDGAGGERPFLITVNPVPASGADIRELSCQGVANQSKTPLEAGKPAAGVKNEYPLHSLR